MEVISSFYRILLSNRFLEVRFRLGTMMVLGGR